MARWGSLGSGIGQYNHPHALAVDRSGNIYVADSGNSRVVKLSPGGVVQWTYNTGFFPGLDSISVGGSQNVFVGDSHYIVKLSPSGSFITYWDTGYKPEPADDSYSGFDNRVRGLTLDRSGNIYDSIEQDVLCYKSCPTGRLGGDAIARRNAARQAMGLRWDLLPTE